MDKLKTEYGLAAAFLKRISLYLLTAALLFTAVAVASHFVVFAMIEEDSGVIAEVMAEMETLFTESKDIIDESGNINPLKLFFNNFLATMLSVALGIVPFIFLPLVALFTNAALMGALSAVIQGMGMNVFSLIMAAVVPHGIFELPALIIGLSLGLCLCKEITATLFHRGKLPLTLLIEETVRVLVLTVVPLLAIAAFVESYITPLLITFVK